MLIDISYCYIPDILNLGLQKADHFEVKYKWLVKYTFILLYWFANN